ncbi:MAG: dihydroorotase [Phyllobacteriaceae bacterium]|nr:dihydroorotase [Phyllobacteriaceae bacterium]
MKPLLITRARLVDPSQDYDGPASLLIEDGRIAAVEKSASKMAAPEGAETLNARENLVIPGLVDMRVHLGEPGSEYRETIASASAAAASGGVTSFVMMPDTSPVIDEVSLVDYVRRAARDNAKVHVYPCAAVTRGFEGRELTEFGLLKEAGAVMLSEGKHSIRSALTLRRALTYARDFGLLIAKETQDRDLASNGVMNEGLTASHLGLAGIPREAEIIALERDLRIAQLARGRYLAAKISTSDAADAIARYKQAGADVSAGVSINHLSLNENDIGRYRTFFRLSPPLRAEEDRQAMIAALRDGIIDVIVSSHDPQDVDTKRHPFAEAADGAIGLETLLAAALRLHHNGEVPMMRLIDALSTKPARLLGLEAGSLKAGQPADLALVDCDAPWIYGEEAIRSLSKNTPFEGARFSGRVLQTLVGGRTIFTHSA